MKQGEYEIKIDGDEVRKIICIQELDCGGSICESKPIITKEVFIECYNKWIKGESEET